MNHTTRIPASVLRRKKGETTESRFRIYGAPDPQHSCDRVRVLVKLILHFEVAVRPLFVAMQAEVVINGSPRLGT